MPVPLPPRGILSIRSSDREHVIALYNPLVFACFTRQVRLEELSKLRVVVDEGLDAGIRGGLLYVIARKEISGGIDARARREFEKMVTENSARSGPSAVVVMTRGFGGAVMRGVIAGLLRLTARRGTIQVFATVEDASTWLATQHDLRSEDVLSAYERATAGMAPHEAL